jgi:hypothetical protein
MNKLNYIEIKKDIKKTEINIFQILKYEEIKVQKKVA